jgi:hypothetical protein
MLDNHSIELINAGVDGELGSEGLEELDTLLKSSQEARELHGELLRLSNFLDALPERRPPPELKQQILAKIRLPKRSYRFSLREMIASIRPLATATTFAAGLLVAVAYYELAPRHFTAVDLDAMVGTAVLGQAKDGSNDQRGSDGRLVLAEDWVTGSVSLQEKAGLTVLNFELDSAAPVEIGMALREAGLAFAGIAQEAGQSGSIHEEFTVSGGTLRVGNKGRQSFVVFLRNAVGQAGGKEIQIEFSNGDQRVIKGLLRTS